MKNEYKIRVESMIFKRWWCSPHGAVVVAAHHDQEDDEHDEEAPRDPVDHGRGDGDGHRVVRHGTHLIIHTDLSGGALVWNSGNSFQPVLLYNIYLVKTFSLVCPVFCSYSAILFLTFRGKR